MPSISVPTAILGASALSAGTGLIGAGMQSSAAKDAAQLQYQASKDAAALQWAMFQQMQGNLQPYMATGVNALNSLAMLTGTAGSNDAQIRALQQQLQQLTGSAPQGPAGYPAAVPGNGLVPSPTAGFGGVTAAPGGAGTSPAIPGGIVSGAVGRIANGIAKTSPGTGGTTGPASSPLPPDVQAQVAAIQAQIAELQGSNQPGNPLTAPLTKPFDPTMESLEATPGYQFTLQQGLRATQNSATAMGLGASGSAIAGAGDYAAGLASQTYQQQFGNYWSQNQNIYNMLAGLTQVGQASAAGVGAAGLQTGGNIGNLLTGGASALGAGQVGAANAWAGGLSNAAGAGGNAALMLALSKNGLFGGQTVPRAPATGAAGYPVTDDYGNPVE